MMQQHREGTLEIVAILTCFNRKEKTCAALRAFFEQEGDFDLKAVLFDDGSTDGTADSVRSEFPNVSILRGDGGYFWNGGMAVAFSEAKSKGADFYLWLNDDTTLVQDALERLVSDACSIDADEGCILIGSTMDPGSHELTYGGLRSASFWHPGKFAKVPPGGELQKCDAMNGNIALISSRAALRTGEIDGNFTHSMGDYDYALRAGNAGVMVFTGRGYHGYCARNPRGSSWSEQPTIKSRYEMANSPKGLPFKEWAYFLKKHGGITWAVAWLATYRRILTGD